ncbi:MAG: lipoxygenase family protein [Zetaproteobacteria bacterium]|nr:lipoxygenase family protein [Zetaproteobacteria bacterium]
MSCLRSQKRWCSWLVMALLAQSVAMHAGGVDHSVVHQQSRSRSSFCRVLAGVAGLGLLAVGAHSMPVAQEAQGLSLSRGSQVGLIEPEVTDRRGLIEPEVTDRRGLIEPEVTDRRGLIEPEVTDRRGLIKPEVTDRRGLIKPEVTDRRGLIKPEVTDRRGLIKPEVTDRRGLIKPEVTDRRGLIKPVITDRRCPLEQFVGLAEITPCALSVSREGNAAVKRRQALDSIQDKIENVDRFHAYDGETFIQVPRGPLSPDSDLSQPQSLAEQMAVEEIIDADSRATEGAAELVGGLLIAQKEVPVATLEDLVRMYQSFTTLWPVPYTVDNWKSDFQFAELRRTYFGHQLKKVDASFFDLGLSPTQLSHLLGSDKPLAEHALYGIDLRDVEKYNANDGRPQRVPGSQVLFALNSCDDFVVLGIKLSNGLVYTPFDAEEEWMMAKIAVNTGEFLYTSAQHFMDTHLLVEPIRVELMRHVSRQHPVHALLMHHLKNGYGNTILGFRKLFTNGTPLDQLSAWGAKGYMEFYGKQTEQRVDFSKTLEQDYEQRGLNDLPGYRQAEDSRAVRDVLRQFVHDYLRAFYGGRHADRNIAADQELQDWAAACVSAQGGHVLNFPESITSLEQLVDTVTHIIYLVAVKHHAMNSAVVWHTAALPATTVGMWAPIPTRKGAPINLRAFLPPTPELVAAQVLVAQVFLRKLQPQDSLLNSYVGNLPTRRDPWEVKAFRRRLRRVMKDIQQRESQRGEKVLYDILSPDKLPYFVWI